VEAGTDPIWAAVDNHSAIMLFVQHIHSITVQKTKNTFAKYLKSMAQYP
jgi:hypothetical protein